MSIPIELDRYTPQAVQLGDQIGNQQAARMAATGGLWARGMAQTGQTVQGAFGDLANGLEKLGKGISEYQKKVEDAQTVADESGAAAFLSGTLKKTEDSLKTVTSTDDVDRQIEGAKAAISDYTGGKSQDGIANVRTDQGRRNVSARSQAALQMLDGMGSDSKYGITKRNELAKFDLVVKEHADVGVENWPACVKGNADAVTNMHRSGFLTADEAVGKLATLNAAAAAYRTQYDLDGLAQATDEADLKARKGAALTRLDEVKGYLAHGDIIKFKNRIDAMADGVTNDIRVARNRAEDELTSGTHAKYADLLRNGMNPLEANRLMEELDGARKTGNLSPKADAALAAVQLSVTAQKAKEKSAAADANEKDTVAKFKQALSISKFQAQQNPADKTQIILMLKQGMGPLLTDEALSPANKVILYDEMTAAIKDLSSDSAVSPAEKDARDYIASLTKIGAYVPSHVDVNEPAGWTHGARVVEKKITGGSDETTRKAEINKLSFPDQLKVMAAESDNQAWAADFVTGYFKDARTKNDSAAKFKEAFNAEYSKRVTADLTNKAALK